MRFTFKHLTGSRAGQEQVIDGTVVGAGRNPEHQLSFDAAMDDRVSGNHAQIVAMDDGRVVINDLGSRNGTLVNGQRISGPTPLQSGAMVEFGSEGGPRVLVTYAASPAPAPAPAAAPPPTPAPPPQKSNKGCVMGCVLALVFGLCLGGAALLYHFFGQTEADVVVDAATEAPPVTEAPPPPPPATEPPPPPVRRKTPWGKLGIGSSFEQRSATEMTVSGQPFTSESTITYAVAAMDDTNVTVTMTIPIPGMDPSVNEMKYPVYVEEADPDQPRPEILEERPESVTVAAGTFTCTYRKLRMVTNGVETIIETWQDDDEPLAYRSISQSPQGKTTSELTKIDKK